MPGKPDKSLFWLGKYLSLALTLPASVAAGYILGAFGERYLHWSFLPIAGIILGFAGGLMQVLRELLRDEKRGKSR
jgi:F0F1-type ATP synthase assembly protein I